MLGVTKKPFMLSVVMLSVAMLNAEAGSQANRTNRPEFRGSLVNITVAHASDFSL
jgi:hypothetical protein